MGGIEVIYEDNKRTERVSNSMLNLAAFVQELKSNILSKKIIVRLSEFAPIFHHNP